MSKRDDSLRAFAHMIAVRLRKVRQHHAEPAGVLADHFKNMCDHSGGLAGGPVTTREMELLAAELVPQAVAELEERIAA
jgi:hypothetical protein